MFTSGALDLYFNERVDGVSTFHWFDPMSKADLTAHTLGADLFSVVLARIEEEGTSSVLARVVIGSTAETVYNECLFKQIRTYEVVEVSGGFLFCVHADVSASEAQKYKGRLTPPVDAKDLPHSFLANSGFVRNLGDRSQKKSNNFSGNVFALQVFLRCNYFCVAIIFALLWFLRFREK